MPRPDQPLPDDPHRADALAYARLILRFANDPHDPTAGGTRQFCAAWARLAAARYPTLTSIQTPRSPS